MGLWYVLQTISGKEEQAAGLLMRKISPSHWEACSVLKKRRLFRRGVCLYLQESVLFPGYVFVRTERPQELKKWLWRSSEFPQPIELDSSRNMIPIEAADIEFLQRVCGADLGQAMDISRVFLGEENKIVRIEGILDRYRDKISRINMHKRFALVEVTLFDRIQPICFAFQLEQDQLILQTA